MPSVNVTTSLVSDVITCVDSLFRQLKIRVTLVGVKIWGDVDETTGRVVLHSICFMFHSISDENVTYLFPMSPDI